MTLEQIFTQFAAKASDLAGRPKTFATVLGLTILWGASGPYYNYSDTWQLIINTSTTIVTCLLCLLLQASTNRSELALQIKLDELLLGLHKRAIGIEHMTLSELEVLRDELEEMILVD